MPKKNPKTAGGVQRTTGRKEPRQRTIMPKDAQEGYNAFLAKHRLKNDDWKNRRPA